MTQIRSMNQPVQKRPGELGVHSLHHFNFMVPDLAQAEKFYGDFGLNLKEENGALSLYTHGHPHRWGSLSEGARKKLQFISFGAYEEDMPKFRERLEQMRLDRLDPPKGFESNGLWFHDPDGTLVEIRVAEKSSPNAKATFDMIGGEVGRQNAPNRSKAHKVQPRRLAHILLFTQDIPKAIAFYRDMLGLRLSDRSGDLIAFMHGIHGSDHHMIAFVKSEGPGLHHCSWDVGSINDIGAVMTGRHDHRRRSALEKHSRFRGGQVGEEARHQAEEEKRESTGKDGSSTTPRSRPWPVIWPFTVVLRKPPVWPTYSSTDVLCNQRSFSPTPLIRVSGNVLRYARVCSMRCNRRLAVTPSSDSAAADSAGQPRCTGTWWQRRDEKYGWTFEFLWFRAEDGAVILRQLWAQQRRDESRDAAPVELLDLSPGASELACLRTGHSVPPPSSDASRWRRAGPCREARPAWPSARWQSPRRPRAPAW
jgi:catechol 2,3-dioxygenase